MAAIDWINLHTQFKEKYKYKKYKRTVSTNLKLLNKDIDVMV